MKRFFDILFAFFLILTFLVPCICIYILIRLTSDGSPIYWSKRVGINNKIFLMPKFRTMKINTPQLATHLLTDSSHYLITGGSFLRKSSLDELPQLYSVLKGDMSFVGPRPALYNQDDLVKQRTSLGIEQLIPGLTGWAQINGRDENSIEQKVKLDAYYKNNKSFLLDIKILFLTFIKVIGMSSIKH